MFKLSAKLRDILGKKVNNLRANGELPAVEVVQVVILQAQLQVQQILVVVVAAHTILLQLVARAVQVS